MPLTNHLSPDVTLRHALPYSYTINVRRAVREVGFLRIGFTSWPASLSLAHIREGVYHTSHSGQSSVGVRLTGLGCETRVWGPLHKTYIFTCTDPRSTLRPYPALLCMLRNCLYTPHRKAIAKQPTHKIETTTTTSRSAALPTRAPGIALNHHSLPPRSLQPSSAISSQHATGQIQKPTGARHHLRARHPRCALPRPNPLRNRHALHHR